MVDGKCGTCVYFARAQYKGHSKHMENYGACMVHAPRPREGSRKERNKEKLDTTIVKTTGGDIGSLFLYHDVIWPWVYDWQGCKEWKER